MPLRADLLNPISGDNPSGANLRYDPVTDKIKEARREDLDVPQGEWKTAIKTADWNQVIKFASDALAKKGKDLQIAVWLADAHIRKEGFPMLAPAFQFLQNLQEQFWDTMYPEIEDGDVEVRSAPLAWFGAKLEEPIKGLSITSNKLNWTLYQESRLVGYEADANTPDKEDVRATRIKEGKLSAEEFDEAVSSTPTAFYLDIWNSIKSAESALESLSDFCDVKFGEYAPSFIKTRTSIEGIHETVEKILRQKGGFPDEEPQEIEPEEELASFDDLLSTPTAAAASPAMTWEEMSGVADEAPTPKGNRDAYIRQVADICKKMRANDPEDPAPYLLIRALRWADLEVDAPLINRESLEAPPSSLRIGLKRQAADADWAKVLESTETAMTLPSGRTWLDLQRYTVQALSSAGYPAAARAVTTALRGILTNVPDLVDLILPDDTPAANAETKQWLDDVVLEKRYDYKKDGGEEESAEKSDSLGLDELTPVEETPAEETPMEFNLDSLESFDTPVEATSAPVQELDLAAFTLDEDPPILDDQTIATVEGTPDIFDEAIAAVKAGNTSEGLGIISKVLATERSGRLRFKRRTQLAHLLLAGGKEKIAQALLDELAAEIEARRLDDWEETEAVAYPLSLLLRCLAADGADNERRTQLYARICKLDPIRALNCSP